MNSIEIEKEFNKMIDSVNEIRRLIYVYNINKPK